MTIELYFSNQLDELAEKFARILTDEVRGKADIFEPPVVIVPSANLAKWLQLFLSGKNSILMNVEFRFLESGLWEMLAALDSGESKPDRMDKEQLEIFLLYILQNLDRSDIDFLPVAKYLFGEGEEDKERPQDAARIWQLSERLAHLFKEYEFHRTDMIRKWSAPETVTEGMERCQQKLYLRLKLLREDLAGRTGKRLLSVMEYADCVLSNNRPDEAEAANLKNIHFFGLSQISNFHLTLIGRLQACYAIHIYTMNPSREFWEDLRTPREKRWIRRRNVRTLALQADEQERGQLLRQADNALLAAWGKPGRESIRLLCGLTDYDFNACFKTPKQPAGILQRIQNDILTLSQPGERSLQDRSLQIVACPSRYREVETVYNSILFNLEQDETLQQTDIAILVPDISAYKPAFDSVFNRCPGQLAYNLVDSHASIESVYGKAVTAIVKLAAGRFSRNEVFDLILNPCFMSRWKIGPDEVQAWANWTGALNIFHTFDRESKEARGYPPSGNFTWKQGLQRLRLARIMAEPEVTDLSGFANYQGFVPYSDLTTGAPDLVEKFCRIIETLQRAVGRLKAGGIGGGQWKQRFFQTCDELIEIPEGLKGETAVRKALVRAFDTLTLYDRLQGEKPASTPAADPDIGLDIDLDIDLDIHLIKEFIRANLGAISGGHGNYLTGGVTISGLQPMRPIPFDIVYVLGMEEGNFPGRAEHSTLDLRLSKRRIGDISLPERNGFLFLEMLLSVRKKLYIGYVSRDLQKDRLQQPCSVVNQLKRYVEQEILPDGQMFRVAEIPLSGASGRYLAQEAVDAFSDVLVNDSLADRVTYYRSHRLWKSFTAQASADDLKRVSRFEPDLSIGAAASAAADRTVEKITMGQLKKFLEHPVREKIRRHLGLYDEEETIEDVVLREDEPFFSEFPLDYRLKMEPVRCWLAACFAAKKTGCAAPDAGAFYHLIYDACGRKNQTPEGAFADTDREAIREEVGRIVETIRPVLEKMHSAKKLFRAVSIGEPAQEALPSESGLSLKRFDPFTLSVRAADSGSDTAAQEVELHGQLPWMWQDGEGAWHALVLSGSAKKPADPDRYVLEPVLSYLLCLAGDESRRWIEASGIRLHVVYRDIVREWRYEFDPQKAEAYLKKLVSDFLDPSQTAWLPFEVGTSRTVRPHKTPEKEIDEAARMQFAAEMKEAFAEEEDYLIRIVKPVIPQDAFDRVRRRFKIYFESAGS